MSHPTLGGLDINLPVLLETRMLVQSNSGGGKSHALRRVLEQTASGVQQIILDPEGEFSTLREKFDYIICAPHDADAVATPATAAALARAIWESGASAIVDIYDLKAHDRILFVRRFCESLINAPKKVWHPTLIAIDEIHLFAPQVGQAESLGAVTDLATRGRKRGLALLGATQRLSKLHKDVAAELLNKLVGRTGLDVDVKRAADELGVTAREALEQLRNLEPGQFYAYGPALSRTVILTRIGAVQTTHPTTGQRLMSAPPPASKTLLAKLATLEGIQRTAADEVKTVEALSQEVTKLRKELTTAQKQVTSAAPVIQGVPEPEVLRRIGEAVNAERVASKRELEKLTVPLARIRDVALSALGEGFEAMTRGAATVAVAPLGGPGSAGALAAEATRKRLTAQMLDRPAQAASKVDRPAPTDGVTGPEQRILDAIAWLEAIGVDEPEQPAVAFLAGYSYGGGAYNNPRGRLNRHGLVEYRPGGLIRLTDDGRRIANKPDAIVSNEQLHARVLERLNGPERRLLTPLLESYPQAMSNSALAAAAGYTAGAGAYNNPRGKLRTLGLIDYPQAGHVVARALLFPETT